MSGQLRVFKGMSGGVMRFESVERGERERGLRGARERRTVSGEACRASEE